jgi:hypothetical protein
MRCVLAATAAKLLKLQPFRGCFFVFRSYVVTFLTINTLQNDIITWHYCYLDSLFNDV